MYWYSGKCSATEEYWTDYTYSLDFETIEDGMLIFNADLSYGRTCSLYHSEAYGFEYRIKLAEIDGQYYISYIDSEEMNFYGFKNKVSNGLGNPVALACENVSAVSIDDLDAMIADYVDMKEAMNSEVINPAEVVDMEEEYEAYLEAMDSGVNVETTSSLYSYERERGRRYADLYYTEAGRNTCFANFAGKGGDCTNFVSQCVWAGYGGWNDGDSKATMEENIKNRKRMQPSTDLANWFGHANGAGDAWANVSDFWNLVDSDPDIGPRGSCEYDDVKWSTSGMKSTEIVTGQVLQFRDGSSGDYAHSVFVTGGTNDSYSNINITQHSPFNKRGLDEVIDDWGGNSSCYMRQIIFDSAYFNS